MLLAVSAAYLIIPTAIGIYMYVDGSPKIKPRENFVEISTGQTVTPEDLVIIDKSYGIRIISAVWEGNTSEGITISGFGTSFTVTEGEGMMFVTLYAQSGYVGKSVFETVCVICE